MFARPAPPADPRSPPRLGALSNLEEPLRMVDQESPSHRPRRAFVEPDPSSATPPPAAPPAPTSAPPTAQPPVAPPTAAPTQPASPARVPLATGDEDQMKPLFRDEVDGPPPAPLTAPAESARPPESPVETSATRSINFAPRRPRSFDDEATTILPRTGSVRRSTGRDRLDDFDDDDEDEHRTLGARTRTALLVGAVAAVIVVGLAIFYAVGGFARTPSAGPSIAPSVPGSSIPTTAAPTAPTGEILTAASMISAGQAATLDNDRTWTVEKTETGPTEDTNPACLGTDPVEGQPTPGQLMTQVLGASGKRPPSALHQATTYASPEEATQAYAIVAKTLGGCPVAGSYIASGRVISGLGDQATGVVVNVVDGQQTTVHSIVVTRTGRALDILDVAQPDEPMSVGKVAKTVGTAVAAQCGPAAGACTADPSVKGGPPPLGGDEPGFLATGDLPPAKSGVSTWVGTAIEQPGDDFAGSGCETVFWATLDAETKASRVYIYSDAGDSFFGVNEIVLTMKNDETATKLATKIKDNVAGCKKRNLVATVTGPKKLSSAGAQNTKVEGWSALVTQKSTKGPQRYRVGIVTAGSKVVYTFSNPKDNYDFTDGQWDMVALRAGERATQVN